MKDKNINAKESTNTLKIIMWKNSKNPLKLLKPFYFIPYKDEKNTIKIIE